MGPGCLGSINSQPRIYPEFQGAAGWVQATVKPHALDHTIQTNQHGSKEMTLTSQPVLTPRPTSGVTVVYF